MCKHDSRLSAVSRVNHYALDALDLASFHCAIYGNEIRQSYSLK